MNPHHLTAILWLRWRLLVNMLTRGGQANRIALIIVAVLTTPLVIGLFVSSLPIGMYVLSHASPLVMMLVWDGLVFFFLMFWMIGLLTELQQSQTLSVEKFLHLPVSLWGVFTLNYISSLFSVTLVLSGVTMLGLIVGLALALGPALLTLLLPLGAFLFMVTAASYQFQGWLASLMQDKRRKRTIVVVVTLVFVLVFQLPNLINVIRPWEPSAEQERIFKQEQDELDKKLKANEINLAEYTQKNAAIEKRKGEQIREQLNEWKTLAEQIAWPANTLLPLGWLPLSTHGIMDGNPLPLVCGTIGMSFLGSVCLLRAYRTTIRFYTGGFTGVPAPAAAPPATTAPGAAPAESSAGMLAWNVPLISEQAAGVALAALRSLTRAPEVKMLLLSPVIMAVVFGSIFLRGNLDAPELARPLFCFGAILMMLLTLTQIVGNQFGFDRGGFRMYVLAPAPRFAVLLGKNLAVLPIALVLASFTIVLVQIFQPLRIDHLVAVLPQFTSMYLIYCMLANLMSIVSPLPVAPGAMKATNTRIVPILLHLGFVIVLPFVLVVTLIPLGCEALLEVEYELSGWPICLVLSIVEAALLFGLYLLVLRWEARLLQNWEQWILEIVTSKAE